MKAIETIYKGYRFRSRLEARWAVFFDALHLNWQYESEGFELPSGGRYLPDFKITLRKGTLWVEIKPGADESDKFEEFMSSANTPNWYGTILNDIPDPQFVANNINNYYYPENERPFMWFGDGGWDNYHRFCVCISCGEAGFEFNGLCDRIGCKCNPKEQSTAKHQKIISAFAKARGARFEHGENGA